MTATGVLALTTLGFDIAVLELFLPLVVGGVVVVGAEGVGGAPGHWRSSSAATA